MLLLSSSVSAALLPACSRSKQGGHCAENDTCGTPPINATSAAGGGNIALAVFTPTLKTDERLAPAKRRSGDEVTSLPGWDGPLPSRQFSGMIDAKSWGGQMHQQHYWLVESERDPKNDPLVVWYQGGPGASSMFGYLVELGPFWLTGESLAQRTADGTPRLIRNRFSWSTVANVLFVDFPAPVGFSQCGSNASCTDLGCCNWANGSHKSSDFTGAEDNYSFLQNFFEEFPEYYDHELFIVGESYAGTYVPLLVEHVLAGNDAAEMAGSGAGGARPLPLVGMAIGNGVVGSDVGNLAPFFNFEWFHGHGQFSERTYRETVAACCGAPACTVEKWFNSSSAACHASRWTHEVAGYYQYNLYFAPNSFLLVRHLSDPQTLFGGGAGTIPATIPAASARRWLRTGSSNRRRSGRATAGVAEEACRRSCAGPGRRRAGRIRCRCAISPTPAAASRRCRCTWAFRRSRLRCTCRRMQSSTTLTAWVRSTRTAHATSDRGTGRWWAKGGSGFSSTPETRTRA